MVTSGIVETCIGLIWGTTVVGVITMIGLKVVVGTVFLLLDKDAKTLALERERDLEGAQRIVVLGFVCLACGYTVMKDDVMKSLVVILSDGLGFMTGFGTPSMWYEHWIGYSRLVRTLKYIVK